MQPIYHDGSRGLVERFMERRLQEHLADPAVKEVRVFNLRRGQVVHIEGRYYKVIAVRPNGKVTLRPSPSDRLQDQGGE